MRRRRGLWLAIGGAAVVVAIVGAIVFQPWLLWVDELVEEGDDASTIVATATAGIGDTTVPDADPRTGRTTRVQLVAAEFIDAEHGTSGRAIIYRRSDGGQYLRLADLETSNGPDLHVWITDRPSGGDCGGCRSSWGIYDDGAFVRLGELKGNQGSQNYEIPADADLSGMRSVVIWCDRFNVAFGTADIT